MFQQESIFCSKISSRGSLFISSGGNQFWGVHFYLVSCPHPFRKNREGVWQQCHTTVCPARSVQCVPIRLQSSVTSRHYLWFVLLENVRKDLVDDGVV